MSSESLRRAVAAHQAGDLTAAATHYRAAAAAGSSDAAFQLGVLLHDRGDLESAAAAYRQAAAGGDVEASLNLAHLLSRGLGRIDEAIAVLRAAERSADPRIHGELGALLARQERFEEAVPLLRLAQGAAGDRFAFSLAYSLVRLGRLDEAVPMLRHGVESGDPAAATLLGETLRQQGQFENAEALFLLALKQEFESAYLEYGDLLADWPGREADAERMYRRAIDARQVQAHSALADLLIDQARYAEAREALENAVAAGDSGAIEALERLSEMPPSAEGQ